MYRRCRVCRLILMTSAVIAVMVTSCGSSGTDSDVTQDADYYDDDLQSGSCS